MNESEITKKKVKMFICLNNTRYQSFEVFTINFFFENQENL